MSLHAGVGTTVRFLKNYDEQLHLVENADGSLAIYQTANVFAPPSRSTSAYNQFVRDFDGEIAQLCCAMSSACLEGPKPVSIGHWSYDMNGSPPRLRVIQAVIAAGYTGRTPYIYVADPETRDQVPVFSQWLTDLTVSDVYSSYKKTIEEAWRTHGIHISGMDHLAMIMDS
jgi:hypothetical protein